MKLYKLAAALAFGLCIVSALAARRSGRRSLDPAVSGACSRRSACRPPPAHRRDALARPGDGRRPVARHTAREAEAARRVLGNGLRLAKGRGQAQRPAAIHDDDRRRRHSLHPCPLAPSERHATDHDAWLAGLGVRAAQDRRPAHRSHGAWRTRRRRLRPGHAFDAGLRLLGQADRHRLGPRPHRASLGGADEAPRLHALRRPGRRLGLARIERDGAPGAGGPARHPHQLAGGRAAGDCRGARRRRAGAGGACPRRNARRSTRSAPPPRWGTDPTPR